MAEYIEREALVEALRKYQYPYGVEFLVSCQPAADVVEVKHGRWITDSLLTTCSECQRSFNILPMFAHYCPNCGARMDGE